MDEEEGCLSFLKTTRPKQELAIALAVIRDFKGCESTEEWAWIPFAAWAKLEQLEDYLMLLTGDRVDEVDDEKAKAYLAALT